MTAACSFALLSWSFVTLLVSGPCWLVLYLPVSLPLCKEEGTDSPPGNCLVLLLCALQPSFNMSEAHFLDVTLGWSFYLTLAFARVNFSYCLAPRI